MDKDKLDQEDITGIFADNHRDFKQVDPKRSTRPDLHAFLLLAELCPASESIIAAAEHDRIYLSVKVDDIISAGVTRDQVVELSRCGVFDDEDGYLSMFV